MNRRIYLSVPLLAFVVIAFVSVSTSPPATIATRPPTFTEATSTVQLPNELTNPCQIDPGTIPFPDAGDCFVQGLINPTSGLVASREGERFTNVCKNSLAAMSFIYEGDLDKAENIFNHFQNHLSVPFLGFHQDWNPCTGEPYTDSDLWVGDNAFLLLALDYYAQVTGSYGGYSDLTNALKNWLTGKANSCDSIIAEGVADMYAALVPFGNNWDNWQTLSKLHRCFFNSVNYSGITDHTVRGALVFGDITGFEHLSNLERRGIWQCDESTEVRAYAASSSQDFINVGISAELLLAWEVWEQELSVDLSSLRSELEKLRLLSERTSMCSGLPYLVRHHDFDGDYSLPIIDSTVYLLYDYWGFNPFAPGQRQAGCRYGKFIQLVMDNQGEGFPRIFHRGQDSLDPTFPQEINDDDHRQIIIEFTTSRDLSQVPITLIVDTVDRDTAFEMSVKIDDGDHCLGVCDRSRVYANPGSDDVGTLLLDDTCERIFLPMVVKNIVAKGVMDRTAVQAASSYTFTYQLVLEGTKGWGVFDWLQLETPDEVLWTIGNQDDQCDEFDNNGFTYLCD